MLPTELKLLIPELQTKKFEELPDDDIMSYIRIYYAMYTMVRDNGLASEYGDSSVYKNKLKELCKILHDRYHSGISFSQRVRLLDVLYTLHYATDISMGKAYADRYFSEAESLLSEYHSEISDPDTVYHAMRLVLSQYYGFPSSTPELKKVTEWLDECAQKLTVTGKWLNISRRQALLRIHILSTYAAFNNDTRYDKVLEKAAKAYLTFEDDDNYSLFYDTVRDINISSIDLQSKQKEIISYLPDTLSAKAIAIENCCQIISEQVQSALIF